MAGARDRSISTSRGEFPIQIIMEIESAVPVFFLIFLSLFLVALSIIFAALPFLGSYPATMVSSFAFPAHGTRRFLNSKKAGTGDLFEETPTRWFPGSGFGFGFGNSAFRSG